MAISSKKIRNDFIDFFKSKEHSFVRSSPVMPIDDETLLFTNAGMNQFKKIFLGNEAPKYKRAVNSQKCIRVSGKHNDLEEVGADEYHHTFFEMLGNWSFGDFYKKEAIKWSWELLTDVWKLDKNRLWITVYKDDDEAKDLWQEHTDVSPDRILKFGNKDNFWEMGETGPCGPCSEIHYYTGDSLDEQNAEGVNKDQEYRELWNLVFIAFNRKSNGDLEELPNKHVDTGAGLERLVATMNNTTDHYKTDLFKPIIEKIIKISNKSYDFEGGMPHRVIADHLRMVSFSLADGIMPSSEGRGYVVRRILRRAIRYGRVLEIKDNFLFNLVDDLIMILADSYPELEEKKTHIKKVIRSEEITFGNTLDRGLILFEEICEKLDDKVISGKDAFKLYDTYGFPLDLTELLAREKRLKVDSQGFTDLMLIQKDNARKSNKFSQEEIKGNWVILNNSDNHSSFVGYNKNQIDTQIIKYKKLNKNYELVLKQTPFYAESGGQIGDIGKITGDNFTFIVEDTYVDGEDICHYGHLEEGKLDSMAGKQVDLLIDIDRREKIKLNHTGTHLLHKALKIVLGEHVNQAGSLVADNRLRFDLTHYQKITSAEIIQIEKIVNDIIRDNINLNVSTMDFDDAKKSGAEALFGEKYDDEVRVIDIKGFSKELCGGTHVNSTGDIGILKIISESSLSTGIRRIEAITGQKAFNFLSKQNDLVQMLSQKFNCKDNELIDRINEQEKQIKKYKKQISKANASIGSDMILELYNKKQLINEVQVISGLLDIDIKPNELSDIVLNQLNSNGIGMIGLVDNKNNILVCSVTKDICEKFQAGKIIASITKDLGLKGGGSKHMAITNFENVDLLNKAIDIGIKLIKNN